ncbi:MAG: hypothetical protein U0Z26_03185 [Anaerolineales bacterium]
MAVRTRLIPRFLFMFLAVILPMLLAASTTNEAQAQTQNGLTLNAGIGFDGFAKEGKWLPIHVQVENNGTDIEGEVRVLYSDIANSPTIYSASVSLPTTSRKDFFIYTYYPQGGVSNLKIQLFSKNKVLVEKKMRVSNVTSDSMLIGIMSETQSTFNLLNQIKTSNGVIHLVEINSATLPDRPQGWEQLDAIIISNTDTGTFSAEQKKALELWIAQGGKLFVSGGPKWQATVEGIKDLLPLQIDGLTKTTATPEVSAYTNEAFPETAETILVTGKPTPTSTVMIKQDDQALMTKKEIGNGEVIFFAADPSLEPFKSWNGMVTIYNYLLSFHPQQSAWRNGHWDSSYTNAAISTIDELNIPSIFFICGWLTFYIALIGPVNYFVLKLLKRREFAWVTIPAIVIIISMTSYIYGFIYRGNKPTLNRLTVIQAWDGVSQTKSNSMIGIYSPQRKKYSVQSQDNFLLYPNNLQDSTFQNTSSWYSIQEANNVITPEIPVEIGGMKIVGSTGTGNPLQLQHDLTIYFEKGSAKISGNITNQSDSTLYDAVLVTPGRWIAIGDIQAGQTTKANVLLISGPNGPEFYNADAMTILKYNYTDLEKDQVARRREAFLRSILTTEYGESDLNWGIYIIGWLKDQTPSAQLKNVSAIINDSTVYIQKISPATNFGSTEITLDSSMFEWEASSGAASPYYSSDSNNGEYTFRFRPILPVQPEKVKTLTLSIDSYTLPQSVYVALWDYTINDWYQIQNINWGTISVPNPANYIGPNGEVKLKIKDIQGNWLELRRSTISMVVQP